MLYSIKDFPMYSNRWETVEIVNKGKFTTQILIVETEGYPFHCDVYGAVLVVECGQILFYRQENK